MSAIIKHNNAINSDVKKLRRSFLALQLFAAGYGKRYGSKMKNALLFISILIVGCKSTESHFSTAERECLLDKSQKGIAWGNVISYVQFEYPDHAKFCSLNRLAEEQRFMFVDGECRIYLGCSNQVNGEVLLHGDMLVFIDEKTQKVIKAYGVKW